MKIAESIPRHDLNIYKSFDFVSLALTNFYLISNISVPSQGGPILTRKGELSSVVRLHMIPIKDIDNEHIVPESVKLERQEMGRSVETVGWV